MATTASRSAATTSCSTDLMCAPSPADRKKSFDTSTSKPESLDACSESHGHPPSKVETLSSNGVESDGQCGGGGITEPAPPSAWGASLSALRSVQSDAPCGGGGTESAPLENTLGAESEESRPLSEELRALAPGAGGAAGSKACHTVQGTEGKGRPADTSDADNEILARNSGNLLGNPGSAKFLMIDSDKHDVTLRLSPSQAAAGKSQARVQAFVTSRRFEGVCSVVILCNAISIAFATDYGFRHHDDPVDDVTRCLSLLERSFFLFYAAELGLRFYAFRWRFLRGRDAAWNRFDVSLVAFSVFDQAVHWVSSSSTQVVQPSFFRIMRLLKVFKLLRVVRLMRCFKGLRLVLNGILGSMQAMFYAMVLITATTFMFGTAIVQSCTIYLQEEVPDAQTLDEIYELWSSVPQSMLSLFMASTSGDSWRVLARPLEKVGVLAYTIFVIYLAFFVFVIANTLTSLFVENSIAFAATDEHLVVQQELEKKDEFVKKLKRFFDLIDTDGSGEISYKEFLANMRSPILYAFASSLDIDIHDAQEFFHVLSVGGTQKVDVQTFVVGCIKLKGNAKSMDLMDLIYCWKKSSKQLVWQQTLMLQRVDDLEKGVRAICDSMSDRAHE